MFDNAVHKFIFKNLRKDRIYPYLMLKLMPNFQK